MNDVVTTNGSNALAAYNGGSNPFAQAAEDLGAGDVGQYLRFNGNTGEYTVGKDQDELDDGTKLIADMHSAAIGWICWNDSEVIDEVMVRVLDGKPPKESELEDHSPYASDEDGWSEQVKINFKNVDGEDYVFKSSSGAAKRSFGLLLKEYGRQFKNHPDEFPIVELSSTSYMPKEKKHGKKHAPTFKIVDWIAISEVEAMVAPEDGEDDPSNYAAEEKTAAPVEEKVVETAPATAPVEGRRRRSF